MDSHNAQFLGYGLIGLEFSEKILILIFIYLFNSRRQMVPIIGWDILDKNIQFAYLMLHSQK